MSELESSGVLHKSTTLLYFRLASPSRRNTRYSLRQLERWAEDGYRKPLDDLFR